MITQLCGGFQTHLAKNLFPLVPAIFSEFPRLDVRISSFVGKVVRDAWEEGRKGMRGCERNPMKFRAIPLRY